MNEHNIELQFILKGRFYNVCLTAFAAVTLEMFFVFLSFIELSTPDQIVREWVNSKIKRFALAFVCSCCFAFNLFIKT